MSMWGKDMHFQVPVYCRNSFQAGQSHGTLHSDFCNFLLYTNHSLGKKKSYINFPTAFQCSAHASRGKKTICQHTELRYSNHGVGQIGLVFSTFKSIQSKAKTSDLIQSGMNSFSSKTPQFCLAPQSENNSLHDDPETVGTISEYSGMSSTTKVDYSIQVTLKLAFFGNFYGNFSGQLKAIHIRH